MILIHLRQARFLSEVFLAILSVKGEELGPRQGRQRQIVVRTSKNVAIRKGEAKILT